MLELRTPTTFETTKRPSKILAEYMPLLQSVFLSPEDHPAHASVVAFTSATNGKSRISPVVKTVASQLTGLSSKSILVTDVMTLQHLRNREAAEAPRICRTDEASNIWILTDKDELYAEQDAANLLFDRLSKSDTNYGSNPLQQLQQDFDFILIECQELQHVAIVAPLVEGVVVVVTANRTRRNQINRAQQLIEVTGGKLLGFVLDRHRNPLPSWLNQWF